MAERAAELLAAPTALIQLTLEDTHMVVRYMQFHHIVEGNFFLQEGDTRDTSFMVLILEGEVAVKTIAVSRTEPVMVTVLSPGSLIGEMGLLDGKPHSASCTTRSPMRCIILSRQALEERIEDHLRVAAKRMPVVALRITEHLRSNADELKMFVQLMQVMQVMQQEISALTTN